MLSRPGRHEQDGIEPAQGMSTGEGPGQVITRAANPHRALLLSMMGVLAGAVVREPESRCHPFTSSRHSTTSLQIQGHPVVQDLACLNEGHKANALHHYWIAACSVLSNNLLTAVRAILRGTTAWKPPDSIPICDGSRNRAKRRTMRLTRIHASR